MSNTKPEPCPKHCRPPTLAVSAVLPTPPSTPPAASETFRPPEALRQRHTCHSRLGDSSPALSRALSTSKRYCSSIGTSGIRRQLDILPIFARAYLTVTGFPCTNSLSWSSITCGGVCTSNDEGCGGIPGQNEMVQEKMVQKKVQIARSQSDDPFNMPMDQCHGVNSRTYLCRSKPTTVYSSPQWT